MRLLDVFHVLTCAALMVEKYRDKVSRASSPWEQVFEMGSLTGVRTDFVNTLQKRWCTIRYRYDGLYDVISVSFLLSFIVNVVLIESRLTMSKERVVIWFAGSNFRWIRLPDVDLFISRSPCSGAPVKHLSKAYPVYEWSSLCSISSFCFLPGSLLAVMTPQNSEITSRSISTVLWCFLCNILSPSVLIPE